MPLCKRLSYRFAIATALLWGHGAKAQPPASGYWLTVQLPVQLSSKWQWHNDGGYRTIGQSTAAYQCFYRPGLRRQWSNGLSAAVGMAFFATRISFNKFDTEFGREFRLWQELQYQRSVSPHTTIQARFRPEQRFFEATGSQAAFYATRLRYRLSVTQCLSPRWQLQLGYEHMHQARGSHFHFNQNRAMTWCIYKPNPHLQWQAGYMWLHWLRQQQQVIQFTFTKTIYLYAGSKQSGKE